MTLTSPLTRAELIEVLPIATIRLFMPSTMLTDRDRGGFVYPYQRSVPTWEGEITLGRMTEDEAGLAHARIDLAHSSGAVFHAYDRGRPAPYNDPDLSILGASAVTITETPVDPTELSLAGLPVGYTLVAGDWLAFDYGPSSALRALHKVADTSAVADGSGEATVRIVPPARPGIEADTPVEFDRPYCKALIVPGSVQIGTRQSRITDGTSFRFVQDLRP